MLIHPLEEFLANREASGGGDRYSMCLRPPVTNGPFVETRDLIGG